jgi:putative peptidoglycan lipid II flippase
MAVGTALSRLTGLGRIFALSYALGVTPLADAYNLANTTPNMIYDMVLGGVLSATLVPLFVARLRPGEADTRAGPAGARGDAEGWRAVSAVVTVSMVVLTAASALTAAVAGPLVRGYTLATPMAAAGAERGVAVRLLQMFAAQILLYGLVALGTAVLNSVHRFALPTFAPIAANLVMIGVLLALAGRLRHLPVDRALADPVLLGVLGLGTTAGVAVQALVVAAGLQRAGARLSWRWEPGHPAVRHVVRLSGWTFAMVAANQASAFAVLMFADTQPGGVSAYTYAYAFFQLPIGVVAFSITGARQPSWAAAWQAGAVKELRAQVAAGLRLMLRLMLPIAAALAVLAGPVVALLLGHGATSPAGAALTGRVLALLALGLPGFAVFLYFIRVYQALQDLRSAFWLYVLNNGLIVALAAALYRPAGVEGVACAVSSGYTVAAVAAAVTVRRRLRAAPPGSPAPTGPGDVVRS